MAETRDVVAKPNPLGDRWPTDVGGLDSFRIERGRIVPKTKGQGNHVKTWHSGLPRHCSTCGADWPDKHQGLCPRCKAGLSCRADTTDTVAPDPPCGGSKARTGWPWREHKPLTFNNIFGRR